MSWSVYILYSLRDQKLYTGCSANLPRRILSHNAGMVSATRYRKPLVLIHQEMFPRKSDAFARERFLKSLWGAKFKKKILKQFLRSNVGLNRAKPGRPTSQSLSD